MTSGGALLLGILLSSGLTGLVIFFLGEERHRWRTSLNLLGAVIKLVLVVALLQGVYAGQSYELRYAMAPGFEFKLAADANAVFFVTLSTVLWLLTTVYAIGYLEEWPHRSRFFGFFSICVSATVGVALAGNLATFLTFYELLTLSTYPLVVHRGNGASMRAGKIYLAYTLSGGALLLLAVAWLQALAGPVEFRLTGALAEAALTHPQELRILFAMFVIGLGVKTALVPLHGWLPQAMVAPAPVSSLLHAVAVVKAGAFGIVRLVYDVYGEKTAAGLGLLEPLAIAASVTIVYGSLRALAQDELKKRLAYSTVSQVSYIVLGTAIVSPLAAIGGIVHLVHQGVMKITMFFSAGNYAETLGIHHISEMNGVGRRMPFTTAAFTVASLAMIGVPPLAGYVTKTYLNSGAIAAGDAWVSFVLTGSSLLNAAYFLPILFRAWFLRPPQRWPEERTWGRGETHWMLLLPPLVTAILVVGFGLFAESPFSALTWARLIAAREYGQ